MVFWGVRPPKAADAPVQKTMNDPECAMPRRRGKNGQVDEVNIVIEASKLPNVGRVYKTDIKEPQNGLGLQAPVIRCSDRSRATRYWAWVTMCLGQNDTR